jgi:hypothetical protein
MEIKGQNESFQNKSPIFLVYQFVAPAIIWFFGLRAAKQTLKGKMTFKQGLTESFKMSLVFAVVSPFVFLAYYTLVNPEILSYVKSAYRLTEASDSMVIAIDMVAQFVAALVFGTIYGAIISFFLKTK